MKKLFLAIMFISIAMSVWAAGERDHTFYIGVASGYETEEISSDILGDYTHSKNGVGFTAGGYGPISNSAKWAGFIKTSLLFPSSYFYNDAEVNLDIYDYNILVTADFGALYAFLNNEKFKLRVGPTLRLSGHALTIRHTTFLNIHAGLGVSLLGTYAFNDVVSLNAGISTSYNPFLWGMEIITDKKTISDILGVNSFAFEPMLAIGFNF